MHASIIRHQLRTLASERIHVSKSIVELGQEVMVEEAPDQTYEPELEIVEDQVALGYSNPDKSH